jgi:hypothetical protein
MPIRDLLFAASTQGAAPSDADFEYVTLLLNGDGTNGAQNNTFLDSSTNNFTITRNGNTTQGSFSPYGNLWSNYFNGSSMLTAASSSDWTLGTGDFTIEAWIFPTSLGTSNYPAIVSNQANFDSGYTNRFALSLDTTNIVWYNTVGNYGIVSNSAPQLNVWTHVAIVRSSSTISMYVNGVAQTQTQTSNQNYSTTNDLYIGGIPFTSTSARFFGYISNLRIVKGSAVYTSNFTPSTTPLTAVTNTTVLTSQSNRFVDNSSTGHAITVSTGAPSVQRFSPFNPTAPYSTSVIGGSGYFDGSGDYLSLTGATAIGTSNYTVEYWIYPTSTELLQGVFVTSLSAVTGNLRTGIYNGKVYVDIYDGTGSVDSGSAVTLNTWSHIAITKSGSSYTSYINGAVNTTWTDSTTITGTGWVTGRLQSDGYDYRGYVSNLRVVVGSVVYTAAFTPPTAPVTAITNTQLLENMTNAGIPDFAMMNNLETVGSAQVSTSVKKYGTGSLAFDGNADYLLCNPPITDLGAFGTGNFTVEMWLYTTTASGAQVFYDSRPSGATGAYVTLYLNSGQVILSVNNSNQILGSTLSINTWYHIALCRSGTSTKLFVDGTQSGSTYTDSTNYINGTKRPVIGANGNDLSGDSLSLNGYIDDLRVTKGLARYTTTFTPPTAALPTF